ncbi:hypothetical protein ABW21_db0202971 [Orbilia brochopaga]|nr:hypothetical protein ABW21_db0202971 [Drechslerella brochopaga]
MSSRNSTERARKTHEEFTERAYVAASRRGDRSIEARIESARRASEIHKRRTGRALRVTETDVLESDVYEEEEDDLPLSYLGLQLTHRTTNVSEETISRFAAYLNSRPDVRSLLDRAIAASKAMEAKGASPAGVASSAAEAIPPANPQSTSQPTPQPNPADLSSQQAVRPPSLGSSQQSSASSLSGTSSSSNISTLPSNSPTTSAHAYLANLQAQTMGQRYQMGPPGFGGIHSSNYEGIYSGRRQGIPMSQFFQPPIPRPGSRQPSAVITAEQFHAMSLALAQEATDDTALGSPMSDVTMFPVQNSPVAMTPLATRSMGPPESLPQRRRSMQPPSPLSAALNTTHTLPSQQNSTAQDSEGGVQQASDNKRKATSELSRDEKSNKSARSSEESSKVSDDAETTDSINNTTGAATTNPTSNVSDITMPTAGDEDDLFDFNMPRHIQELLLAPEISMFNDVFGHPGAPVDLKGLSDLPSLKGGTGDGYQKSAGVDNDLVKPKNIVPSTDDTSFSKFENFEPGSMDELWADFFNSRTLDPPTGEEKK